MKTRDLWTVASIVKPGMQDFSSLIHASERSKIMDGAKMLIFNFSFLDINGFLFQMQGMLLLASRFWENILIVRKNLIPSFRRLTATS